jgi:uncharacterized protein
MAAGETIEVCPVLVIHADDYPAVASTGLAGYYFDWSDGGVALALGLGSLYNHDRNPNAWVEADWDAGEVTYYALGDIPAGTEVCIRYVDDDDLWFDDVTTKQRSASDPKA